MVTTLLRATTTTCSSRRLEGPAIAATRPLCEHQGSAQRYIDEVPRPNACLKTVFRTWNMNADLDYAALNKGIMLMIFYNYTNVELIILKWSNHFYNGDPQHLHLLCML